MLYSIVNLNQVKNASHCFRLDADYFRKDYLNLELFLKKRNSKPLKDFNVKIIHPTEFKREYVTENGILFIRAQNVRPLSINIESNQVFLSKKNISVLKNNKLRKGDILITRTGANYGQCAVFFEDVEAFASSHTFIVRTKEINPFYLTVYLNTKYGRTLINKGMYGASQPEIAPFYLFQIPIPLLNKIQNLTKNLYELSLNLNLKSKHYFYLAQSIILSDLGLSNWQPKNILSYIKNFSDTKQAERFDAEYFNPKYDEIIKAIKNYKGGWDKLGNLVSIKKGIEVGANNYIENEIPFIRVSNISPFEITYEKYISEELYNKIKTHQPKKGEILLSKDGTPGIAYYISDTPGKMIPSGGILRLKIKNTIINEEYLTLVLNSLVVKEQIYRDVGGSVILHWRPDQVKNTLIPILTNDKQQMIKDKIIESTNLRNKSKALLEIAKKAVEIAVEESEEFAEKWIEEEVNKLGIQLNI